MTAWLPSEPIAQIRPATADDLESIDEVYTYYALHSHATFDLQPMTVEARRERFTHFGGDGRHQLLVADEVGRVVGYAYSDRVLPRAAYDPSVATSVYLAPDAVGAGLGTALYRALFDALESEDVHRAYAGIALPNDASIAFHERFGFHRAGVFGEQGRKFGRCWDVAWYEKPL